jgi:hypothetical protein
VPVLWRSRQCSCQRNFAFLSTRWKSFAAETRLF